MLRKLAFKLLGRRPYRGMTGYQWAEHLREKGDIYHIGEGCSILPAAKFTDPYLTWIGNRVVLTTCTLLCHDGSIQVLNRKYNVKIDRVGPIIIEDDVFVGESAIIMPNTRIGEGSIVGAGSVVRQNVPAGSVVMGNPAKVVAQTEDIARFWEAETLSLPWADLIMQRKEAFDPSLEPELKRLRQEHFFQGPLRTR